MKKQHLIIILLTLLVCSLFSQNLQDNPDYRKSLELKRESEIAFDEGDYSEAKRLAGESQTYAALSDEWISMMLSRYKANSAISRLKLALSRAANIQGNINYPDEYTRGKELYDEATNQFRAEEYKSSYVTAQEGIEVLSVIVWIPSKTDLASRYVVQDIPGAEDCLWKIAGYSFVYNDPWQWPLLWKANKDKFPDPENPSLILPKMILDIPASEGETRQGTWEEGRLR